jgi:hypothetical protein
MVSPLCQNSLPQLRLPITLTLRFVRSRPSLQDDVKEVSDEADAAWITVKV